MLDAVAHQERDAAILAIRDAIGDAGCLLDVRTFSGISMSFLFELSADHAAAFEASLTAVDVMLGDESKRELRAAAASRTGDEPITAWLAVTFGRGDPDLRTEIPKVPG